MTAETETLLGWIEPARERPLVFSVPGPISAAPFGQ
jgi:hypothetical protein